MYEKLNIPVLGIIENMSYYVCPGCEQESDLFGKGGGAQVTEELNIPFLGQIPLYTPIRVGGDTGAPIVSVESDSPGGQAFLQAAKRTVEQLSIASKKPLAPVL